MDIIAVHAGAGYQSEAKKEEYFKVIRDACQAGMQSFSKTRSPLEAVVAAVTVLEDSPVTNAGYGSNLCIDGSVECDASVMDGSSKIWSGVGALSGIKNPIQVAKGLYEHQKEDVVCGLIKPNLLVGEGAKRFALKRNLSSEADLTTDKSRDALKKYTDRVETVNQNKKFKMEKGNVSPDPNLMKQLLNEKLERKRKDTVGAVAISAEGMTAAAVSSGGVLLKVNGRVGQAAHFGSGCWAEDNVAVTTSGVGEYLVKTFLAQRVSDDLISASSVEDTNLTDSLKTSLKKRFSESPYLGNIEKKDRIAGILGSFVHPEAGVVELFCSHSSPSMVFGFQTEQMKSPETILSRSLDPKSGEFEIKAFMLAKQ